MRAVTDRGGSESIEEFVWHGETVRHTTTNGGRTTHREREAPGGTWLTPGAVGKFVQARIQAGAEQVVYSTLDPSTGLDRVLNTMDRKGKEKIEILGREIEAIRWKVVQSVMPDMVTTTHSDQHGETLRTEMPFGGLHMVMVRSDRETAMSDQPPAEIMASTLVRAEGEVRSPRTSRRATYHLTAAREDITLPDLPTTGAQRTERLEDGSIRVTIDLDDRIAEPDHAADADGLLARSTVVDTADEMIRRLADRAIAGLDPDATDREKAEAMRRFVLRFIRNKSLDVGFATASEVARNPEGDCTEHAVLLAALLRVHNIPSRAANGLIYVDQFGTGERVFGFHMWTQALIADEETGTLVWEDFDAAWPRAMDATHIITSVTDLGDDSMLEAYASLARVIGVLRIKVESIESEAPEPAIQEIR
jgi:transglutaminase-like putative cysteine protease